MVKRNVNMVFSNPSKKVRHNSTTTSSPFEQPSGFSIYLEPVLNPYWKTYSEILTLSNMHPVLYVKWSCLSIFHGYRLFDPIAALFSTDNLACRVLCAILHLRLVPLFAMKNPFYALMILVHCFRIWSTMAIKSKTDLQIWCLKETSQREICVLLVIVNWSQLFVM